MSSPHPILFTIPNFITAGSGQAMLNIIERLDRQKFSPAVCVLKKGGQLDDVVERELNIPLLEFPTSISATPYSSLPFRAWNAARPFRKYRFRLWHSFHYSNDYTEPIIARFSGAKAWIYTKKNMNWHRRAWYLRTAFATRVAVQNTNMMREFFDNKVFRRRARLVPRGVVASRFSPSKSSPLQLKVHLGIPNEHDLIAVVAHLVPVKGHRTLLEAVSKLPKASLLIAGAERDAEYVASLRAQVEALGISTRVHFLGDVRDVAKFLSEIDVFVLPTWAKWRMDGCPVSLLEAMACEKACVATDIPGCRDLVEDGESGLLVEPENVPQLADAISRILSDRDLRVRLGANARERVLQHFTIDKEVASHESLYEEILGS